MPEQGRRVENDAYTEMLLRMVGAFGRRVADGDTEDLARMVQVRDAIDAAMTVAVEGLKNQGHSWADVARPLGVSREAAYQRWGKS